MSGKKRLIRLHRVLSLVIAIALTIVIAVVVFQRSGLLSFRLSAYINDHYLRGTPFSFSCGKISGDLVGQVSLDRPVLRYQKSGRVYEVFRADRISLDYSLLQVLRLKMMINNLDLENVQINIREDAEGNVLLPRLPTGSIEPGSAASPMVVVEQYTIDRLNVSYHRGDQLISVRDVELAGRLKYEEGVASLEVHEARAHLEEAGLTLRSVELEARAGTDWVAIDKLQVRTDASFVMISGRYQDGRFEHLQGVFNPLDLRDVSALGLIDERGELGGNVVVEGMLDSLAVKGSVTGRAIGLVFSGVALEGVVRPDEVYLSSVAGAVFGSHLNGDVTYNRRDHSYAFRGVCEGLDIQAFVEDEVPETDLNGLVGLEYDATRETYRARGDLRRSTIEGFESEEARFRLQYSKSDGLDIQSVTLARPQFELNASGKIIPDGDSDLIVALDGDSLDYLMDYLSLPMVAGHARLRGRITGPLDRFRLNMNGTWENLEYSVGRIDSSRVYAEARNIGSDDVSATIDIQGRHLQVWDRTFSEPHVLIKSDEGRLVVRDLSFAKGDTFVTSDFQVEPGENENKITIRHLVVRMPHSDWVNESPTTLLLSEAHARLDTLRLHSIGRQVGLVGDYRIVDRALDFDTWGSNIDLDLIGDAAELSFPVTGVGSFAARVYGAVDNANLDLSLRLVHGQIDSLEFDRLELDGGFDGTEYFVDSLVVVEHADSLELSGTWAYKDSPFNLLSHGIDRRSAQTAAIRVDATSHRYPLTSMLRLAHRQPLWGGAFLGKVNVSKTLESPTVAVEGRLVSRPEDRYRLPPVRTGIRYENDVLSISELSFDDGSTKGNAHGRVAMRLGLHDGLAIDDTSMIDVDIAVTSKDLSALARYFKPIATAGGQLDGSIHIGGRLAEPSYQGSVELTKGTLRLSGTEEVYRNIAAQLRINGDAVQLVSVAGNVEKGKFTGSGSARIQDFRLRNYNARLDLTDYRFSSIRDFESTQSGTLEIQSQPGAGDRPIPLITGKIDVKQAVITQAIGREDGPPSTIGLPTESPGWMCDIDIAAPNNVWLRNPDLNMELGGNLIMRRDTLGLYFRGDLSVLRGSYSLYNNKFRITDGRINFSTASNLRPDISINAYTPHRVAGQEEHQIFLSLTWPSDKKEPTIALSYDSPGYSETDLWKMLGGQVVTGEGSLSSGGAFGAATGTATNLASNYLERILNAQMRDVTVDVESRPLGPTGSTGAGDRELTIAVGRYLSEDLYLNYRQGLTVTSAREVDIEYRISNMLLLRSEIIKYQGPKGIPGKASQTADEINFDIKFRFEY